MGKRGDRPAAAKDFDAVILLWHNRHDGLLHLISLLPWTGYFNNRQSCAHFDDTDSHVPILMTPNCKHRECLFPFLCWYVRGILIISSCLQMFELLWFNFGLALRFISLELYLPTIDEMDTSFIPFKCTVPLKSTLFFSNGLLITFVSILLCSIYGIGE